MRTARSSGRPGGGVSPPGTPPGPGTPKSRPLLLTESQTPVKTLPYPNFIAGGKKAKVNPSLLVSLFAGSSLNSGTLFCFNLKHTVIVT